jgi:hypothetical protein
MEDGKIYRKGAKKRGEILDRINRIKRGIYRRKRREQREEKRTCVEAWRRGGEKKIFWTGWIELTE